MTFALTVSASQQYTKSAFDKLITSKQDFLVHVHADWCPTCKVQQKVIQKNKSKIPTVIEVNFDEDKEFKKEYRVFQQSMLIAFAKGKEVARVFGKTKEDEIMSFINKSFPNKENLQETLDAQRSKSKASAKAKLT